MELCSFLSHGYLVNLCRPPSATRIVRSRRFYASLLRSKPGAVFELLWPEARVGGRSRKHDKPAARCPAQTSRRWATLLSTERKLRRVFADTTIFIFPRDRDAQYK